MNKYVSDLNDYLNDNRFEDLSTIFTQLPDDFMKSAEILLPEDLEKLDNNQFAVILLDTDGYTRKYACSTPEMTILNTEVFLRDSEIIPDEICKVAGHYLYKACKKFNYEEGVQKLAEYSPSILTNIVHLNAIDRIQLHNKKEAAFAVEPVNYAIPDQKKYPLDSIEDVKAAIEYFDIYEDHFKQAEKLVYSVNTVQAAHKLGVPVNDELNKVASFGYLNPLALNKNLPGHLDIRSYMADEPYSSIYKELRDKVAAYEIDDPLKLTELITKVDTDAGLSFLWGASLDDPIKCCLDSIKTANIKIDGRSITLTDIHRLLEHEKIGEYLDEHSVNELRSFDALQIFSTFPYPVRQELYKLL